MMDLSQYFNMISQESLSTAKVVKLCAQAVLWVGSYMLPQLLGCQSVLLRSGRNFREWGLVGGSQVTRGLSLEGIFDPPPFSFISW